MQEAPGHLQSELTGTLMRAADPRDLLWVLTDTTMQDRARPGITTTTVPSKIQTAITMPDSVIPNRYPRLIISRHLRAKRIL